MTQDLWSRVDEYIEARLVPRDPALTRAVNESVAAGLPSIAVSATQGKLLYLFAALVRATRILEVGTLGGYSAIWLARALSPDGRMVTLERNPKHAAVARRNLAQAGLGTVVEVRTGAALETLPALAGEQAAPFDLVFVDADKANNPAYIEWAVRLGRPGTLIIVDNVVREGSILDTASRDAAGRGVRRTFELVGEHPQLSATAIQTVGTKGYDGFLMALVTSNRSEP
jgi:predicted O-methyltransferase YrrM